MGLQKSSQGGSNIKTTYVEFNSKAGQFQHGFGPEAEFYGLVSGEIDSIWIEDPMNPPAGKTRKENAGKIPVKLVVRLKDGDERIAVKFPLHTNEDKNVGFGGAKNVAQLFGALYHHFTEREAGRPNAIQLAAGLSDAREGKDAMSWFVARGLDENGEFKVRLPKVWGVNDKGELNYGDQRLVDGKPETDSSGNPVYTMPADFTEAFRDKQFVKFDKIWELVVQMNQPFEEERAQRAAQRGSQGQAHSAHDAGIDPDVVDEAQQQLRQRQ
jgi:hypothetical protein